MVNKQIQDYDRRLREAREEARARPRPVETVAARECGACHGTGTWHGPYPMRCRHCQGTGRA